MSCRIGSSKAFEGTMSELSTGPISPSRADFGNLVLLSCSVALAMTLCSHRTEITLPLSPCSSCFMDSCITSLT